MSPSCWNTRQSVCCSIGKGEGGPRALVGRSRSYLLPQTNMAPKRKEPSAEPTRRSTRTVDVVTLAAAAPEAVKVVKVQKVPATKKAKAAVVEKDEEEEKEEKAPNAKKAKVVEEVPKGVGEVVPDVTLKNGASPLLLWDCLELTRLLVHVEHDEDVSLASVYEKSG